MYLTLPDFHKSLCGAWSELQILLVFVALTHTGGGVEGAYSCLSSSPPRSCQPCPAVPIVYQKAPGSVVPLHSPQAAPARATWELPPLSISLWLSLDWKGKRNTWLFTPGLLYQRKKTSKASFTVFCGYQTLAAMRQWKLKTPFHGPWMVLWIQFPHKLLPHRLKPAWEVLVCKQITWHVFVDAQAHIHSPTYTQRFALPLGLYLFVQYLCSFFPLSIQSPCQNQGSGRYSSISMWKWKLSVTNIRRIQYTAHLLSALILHPFISFLLSTGALSISSRLWLSSHCTSLSPEHSYPQC